MKDNNFKISVITPSYNSGDFIERAIESVLAQDYKNWEHIIIDGGSTDSTVGILEKYKHLNWISEKDNGQADAMNKGFKKSMGDIIVYLNADDYFFPGAFSTVIEKFKKGAKFVVGNVLVKSPRLKKEFLNEPKIALKEMLRHWEPNAFCHNPVGYFYLREVQENCPFNADNYATMDLEFLLNAASKYKFSKINFTLGCFEDGIKTKTGVTQSRLDYWKPSTFPYLEKHLKNLSTEDRRKYEEDRRNGYAVTQSQMNKINRGSLKIIPSEKLPLISVIIPTYNCEKYICRAIDSILAQNLKNVEIVIVDDVSSDNTLKLLKQLYNDNSQIKILIQKNNSKQGAARNRGLDEATGKYIFFLDADDWLEQRCLSHLASVAEKYDTEIVACGVKRVWEDGKKEVYHSYAFSCDDKKEALNYLADYKIGTIVWNKLYLRDFIEKNKLRFITPHWHEDVIFSIQATYACNNYISISNLYYNYFQRKNSTVNTKQTLFHLESYLKLYIDIVNFFDKNNIFTNKDSENTRNRLLKSHYSSCVYPQLIRYARNHEESWRDDIRTVCEKMLGINGCAIADFVIMAIENSVENAVDNMEVSVNSYGKKYLSKFKFILFSPNKFAKKYFNLLLNSKLRQPVRKAWYFVKNKQINK